MNRPLHLAPCATLGFHGIEILHCQDVSGRAAVARCRRQLAEQLGLSGDQFTIRNHSIIASAPGVKLSISHTGRLGVLAFCGDPQVGAIGCDVEFASRPIRAATARRFIHTQDTFAPELNLLQRWVCKEACYKALQPIVRIWSAQTLTLSRLWVRGGAFGVLGSTRPIGTWALGRFSSAGADVDCAVARIPNSEQIGQLIRTG